MDQTVVDNRPREHTMQRGDQPPLQRLQCCSVVAFAGVRRRLIVSSLKLSGFILVSAPCPHNQFTRMSASVRPVSRGVNEKCLI